MPRPGGIDREQHRALGYGRFRRRHRQDGSQDRPDAGRPAECKGKPHHIGAPQPDRLWRRQPPLAHQEADPRQSEEMQAHHDDDHTGEDRELCRPGANEAADERRTGAKRHEHGGKAEHEHQRRDHHRALGSLHALVIGDMLDGRAGEVHQIGRHQRQHAGRQEADQASQDRCRDRYIVHYVTSGNCRLSQYPIGLYEGNIPEVSRRNGLLARSQPRV